MGAPGPASTAPTTVPPMAARAPRAMAEPFREIPHATSAPMAGISTRIRRAKPRMVDTALSGTSSIENMGAS